MTGGELAWRVFHGYDGRPERETRPQWEGLQPSERQCWEDAAGAVADQVILAMRDVLYERVRVRLGGG
jgi:hypothetical protein